MRALIGTWIVCLCVAFTGVALAAPGGGAHAKYQAALEQFNNGNADQALVIIEEGIAIAPKDLDLLYLKGKVLRALRDYLGALSAFQTWLDAGPSGAKRRLVEGFIKDLLPAKTTSLDITLTNGPADIYLESKTLGALCTATSSCTKPMLPNVYKVIAERPGFNRWTGSVTVVADQTTKLEVTLVETPSLLTVRVAPPGAQVTVDGTAYNAPTKVAAGSHQVAASLAGHMEARREATAHEGKPIELDISLTPLVSIRVEPPGAELLLDDKPVTTVDGNLPIPQGPHVLVARAKGFQERRIDIQAERPADYEVKIELAPIQVPVALKVAKVVEAPSNPSPWTLRRKFALAVGGAGVAALVTGMVLGVQSGHLEDDAYARCPSPDIPCSGAREANDLIQRGQSRAHQANIAYGVAGGAAVAAAVLWLTGAPERIAVTPHIGAVAGLDLAVRF